MSEGYRDLLVWQKAMDMTEMLYGLVKRLPKEELYSLGDQMRRSAVSVPSNIAEGNGRQNDGENVHFLRYALGSLFELETQLQLSVRVGYFTQSEVAPLLSQVNEVGKMLNSLIKHLCSISQKRYPSNNKTKDSKPKN